MAIQPHSGSDSVWSRGKHSRVRKSQGVSRRTSLSALPRLRSTSADSLERNRMSRTVEDVFNNTFPVGKQPLSQGGLYTQAPFHTEEHLIAYITAEEVASLLRMKIDAVRKLLHSGRLRASFIGRQYLTT